MGRHAVPVEGACTLRTGPGYWSVMRVVGQDGARRPSGDPGLGEVLGRFHAQRCDVSWLLKPSGLLVSQSPRSRRRGGGETRQSEVHEGAHVTCFVCQLVQVGRAGAQ